MRVEYLVIIHAESPCCRDKASLNHYLQSNADIRIHNRILKYKDWECSYELKGGDAQKNQNRFYTVILECEPDDDIDRFIELQRAVRTLLNSASGRSPQVLWDDVSFYFAQKAYPLVHQIENQMRKLITRFMLTSVGLGWVKEATPEELRRNGRGADGDDSNYLYETDFKDLSKFLFDEYRTSDVHALNERIRALEGDTISATELKEYLPKSNWERYFLEHVNCEGSYLKTRWEKLYKLRCKIAHNNTFSRIEYAQTASLVQEVQPIILEALAKIDSIEVPEEERDEIAEAAALKISTFYGDYIRRWKELEKLLYDAYTLAYPDIDEHKRKPLRHSPTLTAGKLYEAGWLDRRTGNLIIQARDLRNHIVHESDHQLSPDELSNGLKLLDRLSEELAAIVIERSQQEPRQDVEG